jgi:hypothetical protein
MIAHTSFTVTVAICSNEALKTYQGSKDTKLSPIYKVVKTVYASPSRVNFHLDSKKEVETTPAYPEICFAVDDFDSTFDAVVTNFLLPFCCIVLPTVILCSHFVQRNSKHECQRNYDILFIMKSALEE